LHGRFKTLGKSAVEQALLDFLITVVKDACWGDEDIAELFGHMILNFLTNYAWKVARTDIDYPILRLFDQNKISRGNTHPVKEVA
tara:strand:+ start:1068 stop:1322 length:255 start_codon:yes stop_codon:yes gene_type:complete